MPFFEAFPTIQYDVVGLKNYKEIRDILVRTQFKERVKQNHGAFEKYDVKDGETPEMIAFEQYGHPQLHWIVLYFNDIVDPFYEWPLSLRDFDKWVMDKYTNPNAVHHYEVAQSSGVTTKMLKVESTVSGATAVTNYEYEEAEQNKKKQIKLLKREFVAQVVNEFNSELA
tara:strand:- start:1245 stop:1754 length:510 start_codon:yes stop_codon:yes gene_type:complete